MSDRTTADLSQLVEALQGFAAGKRLPVHVTISTDLYRELRESAPLGGNEPIAFLGVPCSVSPLMGGMPWLMKLRDGSLLTPRRDS